MSVVAGLLLALGSAFALNWGWVIQHAVASSLPPLSLGRPLHSLRLLFRARRWLAGFLAGIGGWGLYLFALRLAPLSLVQATSAGGIGLLALIARRHGTILTRRDRAAVGLATAGLVLLGVSLAGGTRAGLHARPSALIGWLALSAIAAALPALGSLGASLAAGAGFGIAAGVLYAAGDVATKAAFAGGIWIALLAVMALAHGGAFACLQLGFQRGGTLATAGLSTMLMNALPIAAGLIVFHEGLPDELFGSLRLAAFASVVIGAALLARGASEPQTA